MKKLLHSLVVTAVVVVTALGYWSMARADSASGSGVGDESEVTGTVDAFDDTSVTIDGVVYGLTDTTDIEGTLAVGGTVEVEFVENEDGTFTAVEVQTEDDAGEADGEEDVDDDDQDGEDDQDDQDQDEDDDEEDEDDDAEDDDDEDDDDGAEDDEDDDELDED